MPTQIISDNFNRANSTTLGNGWINEGVTPNAAIVSNQAVFTSSSYALYGDYVAYQTTAGLNSQVIISIPSASLGADPFALFRFSGSGSTPTGYYVVVNINSNRLDWWAYVNGTESFVTAINFTNHVVSGNALTATISLYNTGPVLMDAVIQDTTANQTLLSVTGVQDTNSYVTNATGLAGFGLNSGGGQALAFSEVTINALQFAITSFTGDQTILPTSTTVSVAGVATGGNGPFSSVIQVSTDEATWTTVHTSTGNTINYTLTGLTPSTTYYIQWLITDSESTPVTLTSALVISTTAATKVIGIIGDSTDANGSLVADMTAAMYAISPDHPISTNNQAISGTATADWLPTNGYLPNAIAAFTGAGVTYCVLKLGTNDCHEGVSASTFQSNLAAICAALNTAGITVQLDQPYSPVYYFPGVGSNEVEGSLSLIVAYSNAMDALVNGSTIVKGDRQARDWVSANIGTANYFFDNFHPYQAAPFLASFRVAAIASNLGWIGQGPGGQSSSAVFPATGNVRLGTTYGSTGSNQTGTLHVPTASQVLNGVSVDATTGNVVLPTTSQVESGVTFGPSSSETGTYAGGGSGVTLSQLNTALASGVTRLDQTQPITDSPTVGTVGEALAAARAEGLGKEVYDPIGKTLTKYGTDGSTVFKVFNLTTDSNGNVLGRA